MQFGPIKTLALKLGTRWRLPLGPIERLRELQYLAGLLDELDINCVLDVGANRGQFAHELRGIGYKEHIISFEPVEQEFGVLSESFASDPKWRGYQMAIGSQNGEGFINVARLTVLSSLLDFSSTKESTIRERVRIRRLDEVLPDALRGIENPRLFLKMDTQGYDVEVFKGAGDYVAAFAGIQSEVSVRHIYKGTPHYLDALSIYEQAGFVLHNLTVVNGESSDGIVELNAFLLRCDPDRQL